MWGGCGWVAGWGNGGMFTLYVIVAQLYCDHDYT